jgi:hypothetical protein
MGSIETIISIMVRFGAITAVSPSMLKIEPE